MFHAIFGIILKMRNQILFDSTIYFYRYLEVSSRTPATIDELSKVIIAYEHLADDSLERNENVRKMISSLLFD